MSGTNAQLARQIDLILSGEDQGSGEPTLSALFASVSEFLEQAVSHELREAAVKVAESPRSDEAAFRDALAALRSAIESQAAQDEPAAQFASDPELMQEFLVEAREHLASVEAGMLTLEQEPSNA